MPLRRLLPIMLIAAGMLACVVLGVLVSSSMAQEQTQAQQRDHDREVALRRWEARTFEQYRIALEDGSCYMDLRVQGERTVWAYESSCQRGRGRTIHDLFRLITPSTDRAPYCSSLHGCICERITRVEATYHARLGYPTTIQIHMQGLPDRTHLDYWRYLLTNGQEPTCAFVNTRTIRVLAVMPIREEVD